MTGPGGSNLPVFVRCDTDQAYLWFSGITFGAGSYRLSRVRTDPIKSKIDVEGYEVTQQITDWDSARVERLEECPACPGRVGPAVCRAARCSPNKVVFGIGDHSKQLAGCQVYVNVPEENLLGGGAQDVSLFEPLRRVPGLDLLVDSVGVGVGEKWAAAIAKMVDGQESPGEMLWMMFVDAASAVGGQVLQAGAVKYQGQLFLKSEFLAKLGSDVAAGGVGEFIQEVAPHWLEWHKAEQSWPYARLPHFAAYSRKYSSYRDYLAFAEKYPEAGKYLNGAVITCSGSDPIESTPGGPPRDGCVGPGVCPPSAMGSQSAGAEAVPQGPPAVQTAIAVVQTATAAARPPAVQTALAVVATATDEARSGPPPLGTPTPGVVVTAGVEVRQ